MEVLTLIPSDTVLLRRAPQDGVNEIGGQYVVHTSAFNLNQGDVDGLSLFMAPPHSIEEVGVTLRNNPSKGVWVLHTTAGTIKSLGFTLVHKPEPADGALPELPGHVVIPELNYDFSKKKAEFRAKREPLLSAFTVAKYFPADASKGPVTVASQLPKDWPA